MTGRQGSDNSKLPRHGLSRRSFLKGVVGAVLGGVFLGAQSPVRNLDLPLPWGDADLTNTLRKQDFADHLNETFTVHTGALERLDITLREVSDVRSVELSPRRETFSTIFHGPVDSALAQGTYNVEHEAFGVVPIFIVPVYSDEHTRYYEAIFNRLRA